MLLICFRLYFQPIYLYLKRAFELAADNNFTITLTSTTFIGISQLLEKIFQIDIFGIPNLLLGLVIFTILLDAYFGVKKSMKESREALVHAQSSESGSPEYRKWNRIHELKKFNPQKLQFTFFKCFTLLGYLFFAKTLLAADTDNSFGDILGFTSGVILKVPLAIFWYYDFKSIGSNAAYIHGRKAPIFIIIENVFEMRVKKHLSNTKSE